VQDYGDNRLTLTTCNPKFSAAQRLIVVAKFVGAIPRAHRVRVKGPSTGSHLRLPGQLGTATGRVKVGASDGWGSSELPLVLVWLAVLIALGAAYRPLRRRWPRLAVNFVLAPVWVCALWMFFEQLNRFLPANL
jgi:sortase A